jgi:WD40 repeat protein
VRFDPAGERLAACSSQGTVSLWQLNDGDLHVPFRTLGAASETLNDAAFLSASTLATAGRTKSGHNVCIWDTLLPYSQALVATATCHASGGGAKCLIYSARYQTVVSGGGGGELVFFDVRQRRVMRTVKNAHASAVSSLALAPSDGFFASGGGDGCVKLWRWPLLGDFAGDSAGASLQPSEVLALHPASRQGGVTDIAFSDGALLSVGSDGVARIVGLHG